MSEVKDDAGLLLSMIFLPMIAIYCFPLLHYFIWRINHCIRTENARQKLEDAESAETSSETIDSEDLDSNISLKRIYSMHCNVWVWLWILYFAATAGLEEHEYPGTRRIGNIYGYIHIPLLSLYMFVETFFCLEWKYLGNKVEETTCRTYIKKLIEAQPLVTASANAFHMAIRTIELPYQIGGKTYYQTQTYQEKVIDDTEFDTFHFARCIDMTPDPDSLSLVSTKLTRIVLAKKVILGDEETQIKFQELMSHLETLVRARNPELQIETVREDNIIGFQDRLLAYWDNQQPKWWFKRHVFAIASFLLLTWVYRILFSILTQKVRLRIVKKIYVSA